jgi:hypothetical protein
LTAGVTVLKSGFTITMTSSTGAGVGPQDCNGAPTVRGYYATATAANPGVSGGRAFAVNTSGTLWENNSMPGSTAPTEAEMDAAPTVAIHPLR